MNSTPSDVVRIGAGPARVTGVTSQQVDFIDETGQQRSIDLGECARNWIKLGYRWNTLEDKTRNDSVARPGTSPACVTDWEASCVGVRDLLDDPPWVRFMNERSTRFEFKTYNDAYTHLLEPLGVAGWHTFDRG